GQSHLASAAPQAASPKLTAEAIDDKTLTIRIETALKRDTALNDQHVDVDVNKGVVTLTGSVRTVGRKAQAGRDANIAGVTRVDNEIRIDANAGNGVVSKVVKGTKAVGAKTADVAEAAAGTTD